MIDASNQHTVPTPVNQKLIVCPACSGDILARVYLTIMADTDVNHHEKSFTTTVNVVGLSIAHDCSPRAHRVRGEREEV